MTGTRPTALVTGCAGFLGSHLSEALLRDGFEVRGVDSFTDYYARELKEANLRELGHAEGFHMIEADLASADLSEVLDGVEIVFHLAAQPGVRLSFGDGFRRYLRDNVTATERLLDASRGRELRAFVYASSSSVYGDQDVYPARESAAVRPVSPYGATKVITEQLAGAFWRSAGIPTVGLRYFTVYGPRQRPDMAFTRFLGDSIAGRPLPVLGDGHQVREFTYCADVVTATMAAAQHGKHGQVYNIGGGVPTSLRGVIEVMEDLLGRSLEIDYAEAVTGDPRRTEADITRAAEDLGYRPTTSLREGIAAQLEWLLTTRTSTARPQRHLHLATQAPRRPRQRPHRILAYSHDGYGLGHLRRNLRIVSALGRRRPDVEILLATGARSSDWLTGRFGIHHVQLPPVVKVASGRYVSTDDEDPFEDVVARRSAVLVNTVRDFVPDVLLADRYPSGMHGELAAALQLHRTQTPNAKAVLGMRDILDAPAAIRSEWERSSFLETIATQYERVLCYGDRAVYDPVQEYGIPAAIAERIEFTGYLADELLTPQARAIRLIHAPDGHLAVCTLGGGRDAAPIAEAFLSAVAFLEGRGWRGILITGPYMEEPDVTRLRESPAAKSAEILPVVDDVPSYLAAADAAVCMGGYNTACELLALAVPAVIVPRIEPRDEQRMRTERLAERGLVRWIHPGQLTPERLAAEIEAAALQSRPALAARVSSIAHCGVAAAGESLSALLPEAPEQSLEQLLATDAG